MSISLSDALLPTLVGGLGTLSAVINKASAHCDAKSIEPTTLLEARLYPDMFTFTRQVQVASDLARRGVDRLAGREPSSVEDNETSFGELRNRVTSTITLVTATSTDTIDAAAPREITINVGKELTGTGQTYALGFVVPNFLFHVSTAYAILRERGVELGKRDFLTSFIAASR